VLIFLCTVCKKEEKQVCYECTMLNSVKTHEYCGTQEVVDSLTGKLIRVGKNAGEVWNCSKE